MKNYYEQLRKICAEKGTTVYAIEKATGVSNGCYRKWAKSSPTADKLIEIANLLEVSVDYLIGHTPKANDLPMIPPENSTNIFSNDELKSLMEYNDGFEWIEKLYKELKDKQQRLFVLTWLVGYLASEGLPVKQILGK